MADKDLDKELEDLKKVSEEYRRIIEQYIEANKAALGGEKKAKEAALAFIKAYDDSVKKVKKSSDTLSGEMDALSKAYDDGLKTTEELNEELESLRRQVNKTTDQSKKDQLMAKKAVLEEISLRNQSRESLKDSFGQLAGVMSVGVASAFKNIAVQALSSGDGISTAGAAMSAGVDLANKTVQVGANSMKDVGGMMSQMGGKAKYAGVGLSLLGSAVGMAADGLSELAKAGIQFMIKETQKSIETFRTMSQSGAMFADGAVGMRMAATDAGMTLQDFSKVTSQNKEIFAKMGMGVTGGTQRLSGAMKAGGTAMQEQLFALGYSMEDQGNLVAQTMAAMSDPTGKLKASDEEVAARTKKYAQDLALISALTGEDIKAKQEKIKSENLELAVQQKLAKMDPKQRAEFEAMQATMNDQQRRQLKENMVFGTVISADLAIMEATSSNFKEQGKAFADSVKDGTASAEKGMQIGAQYNQKIAKDALAQESLAGAATAGMGGAAADAVKGFSNQVANANKYTEEGIAETKRVLEERKKQASTDEMVGVQKAANKFELQLQKLADENLKGFASALETTMTTITKSVNAAAKALTGVDTPSPFMAGLMAVGTALLEFVPALLAAMKFFGKGDGGGGGVDLPDGKGKPKGPGGAKKGVLGKTADFVKGIGSKALGLLPGAGTAAEAASVGTTAASGTAATASSVLGKGAGMALKAAKFLGPAAMVASAGYDAFQGYQNAGENFNLKPGQQATAGQKASSAAGGALSGLTFGLLDAKTASQGVHSAGTAVSDFFGKAAGGAGSLIKGGMGLAGGAADFLSSKISGMGTGYTASSGGLPKEFVEMQKASQEKLNSSIAQLGSQMKDSNKYGPEMVEVLRAQIAKQDELLTVMQENLDINQRLLTQAQG
jgi:hypothetical protein